TTPATPTDPSRSSTSTPHEIRHTAILPGPWGHTEEKVSALASVSYIGSMDRPTDPSKDRSFEGPLAEFRALRQEIEDPIKAQHQILSLQLTLTAAIFGFVISRSGLTPLLAIVPISSYLLCGRLVSQHVGTVHASEYIMSELSGRVPGG